jgi:hypothetical protein
MNIYRGKGRGNDRNSKGKEIRLQKPGAGWL